MTGELTYLARESRILLYSGALGIEIALVYDVFRAVRRVFRCNQFVISLLDLFFWVFTGARTFYMMHTYSNGTLRWFAIFGTVFVIAMYMIWISKFVLAIEIYLFSFIRKVLAIMKKCLTNILKLPIMKSIEKKTKKGKIDGKAGSIPDQVS
jgi:spore cortex biosynthesis protein YabQ